VIARCKVTTSGAGKANAEAARRGTLIDIR
jgi:hypothetical protein